MSHASESIAEIDGRNAKEDVLRFTLKRDEGEITLLLPLEVLITHVNVKRRSKNNVCMYTVDIG